MSNTIITIDKTLEKNEENNERQCNLLLFPTK